MAKQPNRISSKIRPVLINLIRTPTALVTQREFRKAHGDRIAAEFDLNKLGFPVVNHRDGHYWVVDGQHRIYALRQNGFTKDDDYVDCEVYENLDDTEVANIFLGRDDRKAVPPFDKFHIACTAGYQRETSIRRMVEANGQKISRDHNEGISAVGALGKVYDASGDVVVGQVIRTINLGFGGDPLGFDRSVIEGLGLVFNRFNGRTNEKAMGQRLSGLKQGARELLRKAEALRERTGNQKKHCVAAVIVDTYNKAEAPTSKSRLSPWWKETG
jgi:hypothetical protein